MKITALQEYGVRILLRLAEEEAHFHPMRIRTIAEREALSVDYIEKILSRLRKAGLVKSARGLNGGYALVRSPQKISVGEAIMALTEKPIEINHLKRDLCGQFPGNKTQCVHLRGCTIRQLWSMVMIQVYGSLNRLSLADLLGSESEVQRRLIEFMQEHPWSRAEEKGADHSTKAEVPA